jgi:hypothetical protein
MTISRLSLSRLLSDVFSPGLFFLRNLPIFKQFRWVSFHHIQVESTMTTKAPASVAEYPPDSLEKIAYSAVEGIPTQEPNDRYRLGYNVWMWLVDRKGTLAQAVHTSGARLHLPEAEVVNTVSQRLKEKGIRI